MENKSKRPRKALHNKQYEQLQQLFFETKDQRILAQMYECAKQVAQNYLNKYCRARNLDLDIPTLAHDSATYIIQRYLKPKPFCVLKISACIYYGVLKVMYGDYRKGIEFISYEELDEKILMPETGMW